MILYGRAFARGRGFTFNMLPAKTIAIIPARGGSKRIPRKNIKPFNGRPIIAYSIEAAIKSGCFGQVVVSTDDAEIADVARSAGASVPFLRSAENSNDFAGLADVCREVLEQFKALGSEFELLCCILPTAPFVSAPRLQQGLDLLIKSNAEALIPVTNFSYPAQRAIKIDESGQLSMIWPEYYNSRSQDLPTSYHDAGQFYWIFSKALMEQMRFFAKNSSALILPQMEVQDIDSLEDWQLAEIKYNMCRSE